MGLMDLYFAYGSNMNIEQMKLRCPGASLKGQGYILNWRYFINGNGYAGIEQRKGKPSSAYQEIVMQGGHDLKLKKDYLQFLEKWGKGPPV